MSVLAVVSILIRLTALGWSIVVLRRLRDWRMGFLTLIFALMAQRQILAAASAWVAGEVVLLHGPEELTSLLLSVLAFLGIFVIQRFLDEQRRTFEALRASEAKYHTAFRASPDAIVLTSLPAGTVLEVNEGFEKLFEYSRDEALGQSTLELELWADLADRDRLFAALRDGDSVRELEIRYRTRSGKVRPGMVSARKTRIEGETSLISIIRDVTEQHRAEDVRRQAEAERQAVLCELEEKNAELERFTYTVSHDLKSPLITIRGFLGFLEKDVAEGSVERLQRDLDRIRTATETMGRLLDELLELSRIGRLMNLPEEVRLTEIGREAVEMLDGPIVAAGVEVKIDPWLPTVEGDRQRLLEVYQNLIDNAVKFMGEQERPRVELGQRRDGDETVLWVRDNGIGVDQRYTERVFRLFERLDPEKFDGTGIGLALVKRIVEVHGGRIWVESDGPGQGTTMCFTLGAVG
jgi:PAS domain S-box-containing protein